MRTNRTFRLLPLCVAVATCVALGSAAALRAAAPPKLNLQEAPLARETKLATSFAPVARNAARSVVNIFTSKRQANPALSMADDPVLRFFFGGPEAGGPRSPEILTRSLGSGVVISADGFILTNNHVVAEADDIRVVLPSGKEYTARLVGSDAQTDIAILQIEATELPAIAITDSDKLEVGDAVLAIGNPFGVGQTVTVGHVSAVGRGDIGIADYEDFIQTDASISPGNSGGALIDAEGRLVGINTAILSRTGASQGIGFAVPINLARSLLEQIVRDGKVTRGYLGVVVQPLTEELAREFKVSGTAGALVSEVARRGPAEAAGLKEGDVIVEFNGRKVSDSRHLRLMVAQAAPGAKATLKVVRDGREQVLTATLESARPGGLARADVTGERGPSRSVDDPFSGVTVADLDSRTRRTYGVPADVRGALVLEVDPVSPAGVAGLRAGDVILEIDRQPVRNADDAIELGRNRAARRVLVRVWNDGSGRYLLIRTAGAH